MTPHDDGPPFTVAIYDNDTLLQKGVFDTHEKAVAFAVEALRSATRDQA